MWQRKQTIFLALLVASLFAMVFFPIWVSGEGEPELTLTPLSLTSTSPTGKSKILFPYTWVTVIFSTAATLAIFSITKFNNRSLQRRLGMLNSILMAAGIFLMVYLATEVMKGQPNPGKYGLSLLLPTGALIFNMVANFFIHRDERLVRNADRLR